MASQSRSCRRPASRDRRPPTALASIPASARRTRRGGRGARRGGRSPLVLLGVIGRRGPARADGPRRITTASRARPSSARLDGAAARRAALDYRWVACVRSGARFAGVPIVRCNVDFGDPHIQAYCSVLPRRTAGHQPGGPGDPVRATTTLGTRRYRRSAPDHERASSPPEDEGAPCAHPTSRSPPDRRWPRRACSPRSARRSSSTTTPSSSSASARPSGCWRGRYRTSGDVVLMQGEAVLGLEAAARGAGRARDALPQPRLRRLRRLVRRLAARVRRRGQRGARPLRRGARPGRRGARARRRTARSSSSRSFTPRRRRGSRTRSATIGAARPRARRADARRRRLLARRLGARDRRLAHRPGRRRARRSASRARPGCRSWRSAHAPGRRWRPTRLRRAARSSRCWTGSTAGSTAAAWPSPTRRRSATSTASTPRSREVLEEGVEASIARHAAGRAGHARRRPRRWGSSCGRAASPTPPTASRAVRVPDGVTVPQLLAHVRERYGVMLSGGYGELKEKLVRLGHMGPASRSLYPLVAVSALGRGLADLGVAVDVGAGAAAVMDVLAEGARGEAARRFALHRPSSVEEATAMLLTSSAGRARRTAAAPSCCWSPSSASPTSPTSSTSSRSTSSAGSRPTTASCAIGATTTHRELERSAARARALALARGDGARRRQPARAQRRHDRRQPLLRRPPLGPRDLPARRRRLGQRAPRRRCGRGGSPIEDFVRGPYETALAGRRAAASRRTCPAPPPRSALVHRKMSFQERPAITVAVDARRSTTARVRARADRDRLGRPAPDARAGGRGGAGGPRRARRRPTSSRPAPRRRGDRVRAGRRRQRLGRVQAPAGAGAHGTGDPRCPAAGGPCLRCRSTRS